MAEHNDSAKSDSIASLISDIRSVDASGTALGHRHFNRPRQNAVGSHTCQCGQDKLPDHQRCPTCAYNAGLIDQETMRKLLNSLQGATTTAHFGSTKCNCGRRKIAATSHCKACAIQQGRLKANVEPGEDPCPSCGDGKRPAFTYCTACAIAEGYLDRQGQITLDCPMKPCHCGNLRQAAFRQCASCAQGITGYRHRDWTTGPNPVPIVRPPPAVHTPPSPAPTRQSEPAKPGSPAPAAPAGEQQPCWRCDQPMPADRRFCRSCLQQMGAPPEAYDSDFNDRAAYESRPEHLQLRG